MPSSFFLVQVEYDPRWAQNPNISSMPPETGIIPIGLYSSTAQSGTAILPKELSPAFGKRQFLQMYCIAHVVGDQSSLDAISSAPQANEITVSNVLNSPSIYPIGVDLSGIDSQSSSDEIEMRFTEFILGERKTFNECINMGGINP